MCNKKLMVVLLGLVLLFAWPAMAEDVWVNDSIELHLDHKTLIFTLVSKKSGASVDSAVKHPDKSLNAQWKDFLCSSVAIEYAPEDATSTTRVGLLNSEATWLVTHHPDGFDARVSFTSCHINLTLQVRLTDDGIRMVVPFDSIDEAGSERLCSVYIAPAMGATLRDEHQGYLFIPEAAGAILYYTDAGATSISPYSKPVYGRNPGVGNSSTTASSDTATAAGAMTSKAVYPRVKEEEKILAPVYGFTRTDEQLAALFILESGQDNAAIFAYPSGVITDYNFNGALFVMRDRYFRLNSSTRGAMTFEEQLQARDLAVRVCLLEKDAANYSGMALRYGQYLREEMHLSGVKKTGAIRLDVLAAETEKGVFFDNTVPVTTADETSVILETFIKAGIAQMDVYYTGWQKGGKTAGYGRVPTAMDSSLGDFKALADAKTGAVSISLAQDLLWAYQGRAYARDTLARQINRQSMQVLSGHRAYPQMSILSPLILEQYADALMQSAGEMFELYITGIGNTLFSHAVSSTERYSRLDTLERYAALLDKLTQNHRLALEQPFACYLPYTDAYLDMPMETTNYTIIDAAVPFLPMALDGLVECWSEALNFSADPAYTQLKLIEYGLNPTWILTKQASHVLQDTNSDDVYAAQWDQMLPRILKQYNELAPVWKLRLEANVCRHEFLTEDVVQLTYTNGVSILINYGKRDWYSADGTKVEARSWCIQGGG